MSTMEMEISFWRAVVGNTRTEAKGRQQINNVSDQDMHLLLSGPLYLAGQYFPKVAPLRSSTVPVKPVELAPRGLSKKLLACTTSVAPCQGMPWHGQHMSCLPANNLAAVQILHYQASCFSNWLSFPWPLQL